MITILLFIIIITRAVSEMSAPPLYVQIMAKKMASRSRRFSKILLLLLLYYVHRDSYGKVNTIIFWISLDAVGKYICLQKLYYLKLCYNERRCKYFLKKENSTFFCDFYRYNLNYSLKYARFRFLIILLIYSTAIFLLQNCVYSSHIIYNRLYYNDCTFFELQ